MMIDVYKERNHPVIIEQTKMQRDWMDETFDRHAYKCFPLSSANRLGWSISFSEDIEFIWDGISDSSPNHVKIIKGPSNVCMTNRGNATISFNTGLTFKTPENVSIISIHPPNYFIDGAMAFTSIMSTSFYEEVFPVAWKITKSNEKITIPSGHPVITLLPVSITGLCNIELNLYNKEFAEEDFKRNQEKAKKWEEISKQGKFTNFYRDAVDYNGNKIGNHEEKVIVMKMNDFTK